jgi:hypothetical protein
LVHTLLKVQPDYQFVDHGHLGYGRSVIEIEEAVKDIMGKGLFYPAQKIVFSWQFHCFLVGFALLLQLMLFAGKAVYLD